MQRRWGNLEFFSTIQLAVLLLLLALFAPPASAGYDPWSDWQRARDIEASDPAAAENLYRRAAGYFEQQGDLINAGLAWQKIFYLCERQGKLIEAGEAYAKEAALFERAGKPDWAWGETARGEALRPVVRLFYQVGRGNTPSLAKFEPVRGAYLGLYEERGQASHDYNRVKELYGRQHALFLSYAHIYGPGEVFLPWDTIHKVQEVPGAGLVLALEPNCGLDGLREEDILDIAWQLGELNIPVFLRFASEMNMEGTNQWHGDPQKYVFWFRKVASIMREYAPNVAMVWNPFDIVQPEGVKAGALSYYPGDTYVDWVGVNFYSDYYLSGRADQPGAGIDPLQRLDYWYRMFAGRKPLMVGEFGIAHTALKPYQEDVSRWAANYIRKFYSTLPILYPRVKAVVYFDLNESDPLYTQAKVSDYRLSDKEEVLRAYREAIASPYYLEQVGQSSTASSYRELNEGEKLNGEVILGAYAKIYDPFISRVEYYLDGRLIARTSTPPYLAKVDFSRAYGPVSLEVKVFDSQGREAFSQAYLVEGRGIPAAVFTLGEKRYTSRGETKEMDVAPFTYEGRTFVPLRFLAQALGVPGEGIFWDEKERLVKISSQGHTIVLQVGRKEIEVDGRVEPMDVAPVEREERVFLPARYVAEALGYEVGWVEKRQQVVVW
ncbi:MAG: hypothetical protein L5656_11120, partial [Thermanaeromonas sp.]|uniref:stalk domain-containing protein n=1 Tax=Thermanaeromonas sp. TaxID=2003697 RepID=UPI00243FE103